MRYPLKLVQTNTTNNKGKKKSKRTKTERQWSLNASIFIPAQQTVPHVKAEVFSLKSSAKI